MSKVPVKGLYYGLSFFVGFIMSGISLDMLLETSDKPIYAASLLFSLFVALSSIYYMVFEFGLFPFTRTKEKK